MTSGTLINAISCQFLLKFFVRLLMSIASRWNGRDWGCGPAVRGQWEGQLVCDALLKLPNLIIIVCPLCHNPNSAGQFRLLGEGVVTEVNRLCLSLAFVAAPCFTPQPLLGEGLDWNLMDHVVWQVLVQVGEAVWVLGQSLKWEWG